MSYQKKSQRKIEKRTQRRAFRVKNSQNRGSLPRVSVFRSLKQIYAQIIDDSNQKTLVSFSSLALENAKGKKTDIAKKVGIELGKIALSNSIENVFFDRGQFLYHGRVKALAEGLRESGLKF